MKNYSELIKTINTLLDEFNLMLSDDYKIAHLDLASLDDTNYYLDLKNKTWGDYTFPRNREVGGVYFYFGFNTEDPSEKCVYIGKASYSRTTGQRLWSHFKHKEHIIYNNIQYYKNENYAIEMITSIPFEIPNSVCLASALEEFLIKKMAEKSIPMFNSIGNG